MKEMKNENNQNEDRGKLTTESEQRNRSSIRFVHPSARVHNRVDSPFIFVIDYK
jgi:hypothetical protein